jgi:hypothetical protein
MNGWGDRAVAEKAALATFFEFDAAGDFDRLLPEGGSVFAVLGSVDPYGDTALTTVQMDGLLAEINALETRRLRPTERRGLERLRVLATRCRDDAQLYLKFIGG